MSISRDIRDALTVYNRQQAVVQWRAPSDGSTGIVDLEYWCTHRLKPLTPIALIVGNSIHPFALLEGRL